jgi:transcriptional regulator with GAF, ATPase, and Fis domain
MSNHFTPSHPSSVPGHVGNLVAELCTFLGQSPAASLDRTKETLSKLTASLAFDEGTLIAFDQALSGANRVVTVSTKSLVDSHLTDLVSRPWLRRAVQQVNPVLLSGTPSGTPDVPADEHRRLWATGVRTLVCAPWRNGDRSTRAALLCLRHSTLEWESESLEPLIGLTETLGKFLLGDGIGRPDAPPDAERTNGNHKSLAAEGERHLDSGLTRAIEDEIVGESVAWRYVMFRVEQVAATHATVLLLGETGTGKELIARAIHQRSPRRHSRFVALNCAALPATLIESELFGRERGAFTGAHTSQAGRFELAHRGTLFLDEAGDLPLELQPKLLRVLQEGQLDRLGGTRTMNVDVRVIAATNRDLTEDVQSGRFRRDLYYRINVFPITLPSLRDRREDIPLLARHLADRFARQLRKNVEPIPPQVMRTLQEYHWPGNIRELENVIQRAIILTSDGVLSLNEISLPLSIEQSAPPSTTLEAVEREHILRVLVATSWRIEGPRGAAQILGLKPSTLRSRLQKLAIKRGAA